MCYYKVVRALVYLNPYYELESLHLNWTAIKAEQLPLQEEWYTCVVNLAC